MPALLRDAFAQHAACIACLHSTPRTASAGTCAPEAARVQGSNEAFRIDMPAARLALLAQRTVTQRGQAPRPSRFLPVLHRDMFALCWGPLVRAIAALLDTCSPDDTVTITDGMEALRAVRHCACAPRSCLHLLCTAGRTAAIWNCLVLMLRVGVVTRGVVTVVDVEVITGITLLQRPNCRSACVRRMLSCCHEIRGSRSQHWPACICHACDRL